MCSVRSDGVEVPVRFNRRERLGAVVALFTLLAGAFGAGGAWYSAATTQSFVREELRELKVGLAEVSRDRWTRAEDDARMLRFDTRLTKLEDSHDEHVRDIYVRLGSIEAALHRIESGR